MTLLIFLFVSYFNLNIITCVEDKAFIPIDNISQYRLYFDSLIFDWNNPEQWTPNGCSVHIPTLCIEFQNNTPNAVLLLRYNDNVFDFSNDQNWSKIDSIYTMNDNNDDMFLNDFNESMHLDGEYDTDEFGNDITLNPGRNLLASRGRRTRCRVYVYSRKNNRGARVGPLRRSRYTLRQLRKEGVNDNDISSLKVRGRRCCTAKLYSRDRFRGRRGKFRYGRHRSVKRKGFRDNTASSLRIYCSVRRKRSRRSRSRRRRKRRRRCKGCNANGMRETNVILKPRNSGTNGGMGGMGGMGGSMNPMMMMMMPMLMSSMMNGGKSNGNGNMFGMGGNSKAPQAAPPVIHVYPERRKMIESLQVLQKCAVVKSAEICVLYSQELGTFALKYTFPEKIEPAKNLEFEYEYVNDNDLYNDDDDDDDVDVMTRHKDYGLWRNEMMFWNYMNLSDEDTYYNAINAPTEFGEIYVWNWNINDNINCNQELLGFTDYKICVEPLDNGETKIFFEKNDVNLLDDNDEDMLGDVDDEMNDKQIIESELDSFVTNLNQNKWNEITTINFLNEKIGQNREFCKFVSLVKLCIQYNASNMEWIQFSAQFLRNNNHESEFEK